VGGKMSRYTIDEKRSKDVHLALIPITISIAITFLLASVYLNDNVWLIFATFFIILFIISVFTYLIKKKKPGIDWNEVIKMLRRNKKK